VAAVDTTPPDPLAWRPQVARPGRRARSVSNPIIEPHWQGAHVLVHVDADRRGPDGGAWCVILDSYGDDITDEEPAVTAALRSAVHADDAVIDGFLTDQATRPGTTVSVLPIGRRSGNIVMGRRMDPDVATPIDDGEVRPVAFVAVDLLRVDGRALFDVPLLERNHDVDVDRGAGFPGEGTGDRATDRVGDAQRVQLAHDEKRRFDRIDGRSHRTIIPAASGYARHASSGPSTMTATRRNCSRGVASG